jgi:hypothetical protein
VDYPSFKRRLCELYDHNGKINKRCLVQYSFEGTPSFKLLANAESIVDEPGNANAKLVARSGEGRLNFLQVGRSPGILSCECEGFKEKGGICSHTVAVAEITGYLRQHLSTYQKGQQLNITRLAAQVHLQRKWLVLLHLIMTPTK